MQEEIKEILEIFKKINEEYSVDTELDFEDYEIPNIYLKQFLDYITNLQEYETIIEMEFKREYARRYLEERRKEEPHLLYPDSDEIYKRYYELKEENKKLKELCDKYEEEHKTTFEYWKQLVKEDYKSRNEKAIEYINKFESIKAYYEYIDEDGYDEYNYDDDFKKDILNILKGDNK